MPGTEQRIDPDRAAELVGLVRRVPSRLRRFSATEAAARTRHRIDAGLLDRLIGHGLPVVAAGGLRLFDDYDLANISLHLGLTSVRRRALRSWAGALRAAPGSGRAIGYAPSCPAPGHTSPCRFGLLVPGGRRVGRAGGGDGVTSLHTLTVRPRTAWPELPSAVAELLAEPSGLHFFLLPETLRWDLGFLRDSGLADCGGATRLCVREGRRRGLDVRFSFGLLVAKPYSTPHCWAEFRVDDVWVPVDPLLVSVLCRWGGLPAREWPPTRSPGALFTRLCGRFDRVAVHDGLWSGISLPTEVIDREGTEQG